MTPRQGLLSNLNFGELGQTLNNLPLSGSLGLLTAGAGLLEGQPIGQAVRSGFQTFQGFEDIEQRRKRRQLIDDLVKTGGFSAQEQKLIQASQNPAAVAAQLRNQKLQRSDAAAARAATLAQNKVRTLTSEEVLKEGFPAGSIVQEQGGKFNIVFEPSASPKPIFREFDGDLYRIDGDNITLVQQGTDEINFVTVGGVAHRQEGGELIPVTSPQPRAASPKNFISQQEVVINGQTISPNQIFSLDLNDSELVASAQQQGAYLAPVQTEDIVSNVTNEQIKNTVDEIQQQVSAEVDPVDIAKAAGGDIAGRAIDALNFVAGQFGASFDPTRNELTSIINVANTSIKVPLVKAA